MRYFAYGSNMSVAQMRQRCPGHAALGIALLPGYRLCFPRSSPIRRCGVAGVEPCEGAQVWGVVYHLTAEDLEELDRREGYDPQLPPEANRYVRTAIRVLMDGDAGRAVPCEAYLARRETGQHTPSAAYLATIIEGAEEHGLPRAYVGGLRAISSA